LNLEHTPKDRALDAAKEEIAMLKLREHRLRDAMREIAQRLSSVEKSVYAQILKRAGLMDWISAR
jgi:chaperonin cofactor prefoldin